jgi:hypothetical protein
MTSARLDTWNGESLRRIRATPLQSGGELLRRVFGG